MTILGTAILNNFRTTTNGSRDYALGFMAMCLHMLSGVAMYYAPCTIMRYGVCEPNMWFRGSWAYESKRVVFHTGLF